MNPLQVTVGSQDGLSMSDLIEHLSLKWEVEYEPQHQILIISDKEQRTP